MKYSYSSRQRVVSTACPGVTYTLNKMTEGRRIKVRTDIFGASRKVRGLLADLEPITARMADVRASVEALKEYNALPETERPPNPPAVLTLDSSDYRRVEELTSELQEINDNQIYPVWMKYGLHSVEGLEIDDKEATPEDIFSAPQELYQEVLAKIQGMMGLTEEEIKNLQSLFTSSVPAAGQTNDTSVESAKSPDGIASETADATSLTT